MKEQIYNDMGTTQILEAMDFVFETENPDGKWMRFRHKLSDRNERDFALVIYDDYTPEQVLKVASNMLRKIGQAQKMKQITSYLE